MSRTLIPAMIRLKMRFIWKRVPVCRYDVFANLLIIKVMLGCVVELLFNGSRNRGSNFESAIDLRREGDV
jgi:hypothetical protein